MRFRFTIRDLLWLVVVVAMAIGWWLDRLHMVRIANEQVEACEKRLNDTVEELAKKPISELEREAIGYKERRDVYRAELVDLIKITSEFANQPGYEQFKSRLEKHNREFTP
jgi:hypothetical protein